MILTLVIAHARIHVNGSMFANSSLWRVCACAVLSEVCMRGWAMVVVSCLSQQQPSAGPGRDEVASVVVGAGRSAVCYSGGPWSPRPLVW